MRTSVVVAICTLLTGCSDVLTLHPLVTEQDVHVDRALLGVWEYEADQYRVLGAPGGVYEIVGNDDKLRARLTKIGEAVFAEITQAQVADLSVPVHLIARVKVEGSSLHLAFFGSDWLEERLEAEKRPAFERVKDRWLITAPTAELREMMRRHAQRQEAFLEEIVLRRPKP